jgi:hypothetical protein
MDTAKLLGGRGGGVHTGGSLVTEKPEYIRRALDVVAVALHAIFIGLAYRKGPDEVDTDVLLLVVMSAITIFFHLVYLWGLLKETRPIGKNLFTFGLKERNTLKWLEYSITATLGTLALAYSHPDHPLVVPSTLFFIAAVAVTEQATGYLWDSIDSFKGMPANDLREWPAYRAYFLTFVCQAAEFWILADITGISSPWVAYFVTWTLFGAWAGLRPIYLDTLDGNEVQVSEIGYSILSTTAKISLFGTILQEKGIIG